MAQQDFLQPLSCRLCRSLHVAATAQPPGGPAARRPSCWGRTWQGSGSRSRDWHYFPVLISSKLKADNVFSGCCCTHQASRTRAGDPCLPPQFSYQLLLLLRPKEQQQTPQTVLPQPHPMPRLLGTHGNLFFQLLLKGTRKNCRLDF